MAVFVGCKAIVFLIVYCLSPFLHAQTTLNQDPDPSTAATEQETDSPILPDGRPRGRVSAVEETTPAVCSYGMKCKFRQYSDDFNREKIIRTIHYCHCPSGTSCDLAGDDMEQRYLYYKCLSTEPQTSTEPASRNTGETTEMPLSTGTERSEATEGVDSTTTESDASTTAARSAHAKSLRNLRSRVGDVMEHAEL